MFQEVIFLLLIFSVILVVAIPKPEQKSRHFEFTENDPEYWHRLAKKTIKEKEQSRTFESTPKAKNAILFLGDGMGIHTVTAARILKGQMRGGLGEDETLNFDEFPYSSLIKTYNIDQQTPDSAGTATAYLCGVKTNLGIIGVNGHVKLDDPDCESVQRNSVPSMFKWASDSGKMIGLVTTTRVTHASPAGCYAHVQNRGWEYSINDEILISTTRQICKDIARQLIEDDPGRKFNVIMGGGRRNFLPKHEHKNGYRDDGRDLIQLWNQQRKNERLSPREYIYVNDTKTLRNIDYSRLKFLFGLFNDNHMTLERARDNDIEPSLTEMVEAAIKVLSNGPNGYLLFVEGGRIDHAHHSSMAAMALFETIEFDRAIGMARKITKKNSDTLIVVTADHSHSLVLNGYAHRGSSIIGPASGVDSHNKSFTILIYGNGPGYIPESKRLSRKEFYELWKDHKEWLRYHSAIPISDSSHHSGEDVAVWADGPMAYMFSGGTHEQSYIPHAISYSMCIGQYSKGAHCHRNHWRLNLKNDRTFRDFFFFLIISTFWITLAMIPVVIRYLKGGNKTPPTPARR